ncbi:unnamed protein product [Amoebophrya sp. A120]|nr:unnamed protein product [Amoebophrya sp. A120]|eukprot:GSA120T00001348001.1
MQSEEDNAQDDLGQIQEESQDYDDEDEQVEHSDAHYEDEQEQEESEAVYSDDEGRSPNDEQSETEAHNEERTPVAAVADRRGAIELEKIPSAEGEAEPFSTASAGLATGDDAEDERLFKTAKADDDDAEIYLNVDDHLNEDEEPDEAASLVPSTTESLDPTTKAENFYREDFSTPADLAASFLAAPEFYAQKPILSPLRRRHDEAGEHAEDLKKTGKSEDDEALDLQGTSLTGTAVAISANALVPLPSTVAPLVENDHAAFRGYFLEVDFSVSGTYVQSSSPRSPRSEDENKLHEITENDNEEQEHHQKDENDLDYVEGAHQSSAPVGTAGEDSNSINSAGNYYSDGQQDQNSSEAPPSPTSSRANSKGMNVRIQNTSDAVTTPRTTAVTPRKSYKRAFGRRRNIFPRISIGFALDMRAKKAPAGQEDGAPAAKELQTEENFTDAAAEPQSYEDLEETAYTVSLDLRGNEGTETGPRHYLKMRGLRCLDFQFDLDLVSRTGSTSSTGDDNQPAHDGEVENKSINDETSNIRSSTLSLWVRPNWVNGEEVVVLSVFNQRIPVFSAVLPDAHFILHPENEQKIFALFDCDSPNTSIRWRKANELPPTVEYWYNRRAGGVQRLTEQIIQGLAYPDPRDAVEMMSLANYDFESKITCVPCSPWARFYAASVGGVDQMPFLLQYRPQAMQSSTKGPLTRLLANDTGFSDVIPTLQGLVSTFCGVWESNWIDHAGGMKYGSKGSVFSVEDRLQVIPDESAAVVETLLREKAGYTLCAYFGSCPHLRGEILLFLLQQLSVGGSAFVDEQRQKSSGLLGYSGSGAYSSPRGPGSMKMVSEEEPSVFEHALAAQARGLLLIQLLFSTRTSSSTTPPDGGAPAFALDEDLSALVQLTVVPFLKNELAERTVTALERLTGRPSKRTQGRIAPLVQLLKKSIGSCLQILQEPLLPSRNAAEKKWSQALAEIAETAYLARGLGTARTGR